MITDTVPAYLYWQYSDDENLQAFIDSYNTMTQSYLDWYNDTPLAIYTDSSISGSLLDWIAQGIYGISRPVIGTYNAQYFNTPISVPTNTQAVNRNQVIDSGTSQIVNDDIYKRCLTWFLYKGDGMQMSIPWIRRRVARFIYGSNGSDFDLSNLQYISISTSPLTNVTGFGGIGYGPQFFGELSTPSGYVAHSLTISIPRSTSAVTFQELATEGILNLPFQVNFTIILT